MDAAVVTPNCSKAYKFIAGQTGAKILRIATRGKYAIYLTRLLPKLGNSSEYFLHDGFGNPVLPDHYQVCCTFSFVRTSLGAAVTA